MGDIQNLFRWSSSRQKKFEQCRRYHYLSQYAFWGGWDSRAPALSQLCYRLKKMTNLFQWAGSIVHDVITLIVEDRGMGALESYLEIATQKLRDGWKQSVDERWKFDAKRNINIFEHYYHKPPARSHTDKIKQRIFTCIENFYRSDELKRISEGEVQTMEQYQEIRVAGFLVSLKMDLAVRFPARKAAPYLTVYDWKTGRRRDADPFTMAVYRMYAVDQWGEVPAIKLFYLLTNEIDANPNPSVVGIKERIQEQCEEMARLLTGPEKGDEPIGIGDYEKNEPIGIEHFPMAENRRHCLTCEFFHACYRAREIPESEVGLLETLKQ